MTNEPAPLTTLLGQYSLIHRTDADCRGYLADDDTCNGCGVAHGDPCRCCGGRGFHRPGCTEWPAEDQAEARAAARRRLADANRAFAAAVAAGDLAAQGAAARAHAAASAELHEFARADAAADSAHYGDTMPAWATYGS